MRLIIKKILAVALAIVLCCACPVAAMADGSMSSEEINLEKTGSSNEALAYGMAPDHLFPFVFNGSSPYFHNELDTTGCELGRVYVHNQNTDEIVPIGTDTVTVFAATKDALFYVTTEQELVQTDYTGTVFTTLYKAEAGAISSINVFWDTLYFLESGNRVILLDTTTGNAQTVLLREGIDGIFMYADEGMMCYMIDGSCVALNLATGEAVTCANENEAYMIIYTHITPDEDEAAAHTNSLSLEYVNDVAIPLTEYPATSDSGNSGYTYLTPSCYFHTDKLNPACSSTNCKRYAGAGECDGFARYAHDKFLHIYNSNKTNDDWYENHLNHTDQRFSSVDTVKNYFQGLSRGAFVRYGKDSDTSGSEGCHSIFLDKYTSSGIWVYECNQGDANCGIFYKFYTFAHLQARYNFVAITLTHSFGNIVQGTAYRYQYCTQCSGYLRQATANTGVASTMHMSLDSNVEMLVVVE